MTEKTNKPEAVVIKFAGDSGDGMQLSGTQFTNTVAFYGNDLATFPDFPAEIRAPLGTLFGVSGFQVHFGSKAIYTPGDDFDVLVAMNAAAYKTNIDKLKQGGILIINTAGFDTKNLRLAKFEEGSKPLDDPNLSRYTVYRIDITKLTRDALMDGKLGTKEKDRSKNMFALGFVYWLFDREPDHTIDFISNKFKKRTDIAEANIKVLKAGYNYGLTTESPSAQMQVAPAQLAKGTYRNIRGNEAMALGLIAASKKAGLNLFYSGYPITPASDILHELAKHKNFGAVTFQAEDEIAAISSAIGASFGGALGVTASSGPGIALKGEALGLAMMLELPLVIINVQRSGPSTGMPTKTEQADLLQALYGRNGEAPIPVIAAKTPGDCFYAAYEAAKIAVEHMTPVMVLSDGYIGNGAQPWKIPTAAGLPDIKIAFEPERQEGGETFLPYKRDEKLSRPWAIPGTKGLAHRVGGLSKEHETGNVSYNPENHEFMVKLREEKVDKIADFIPEQRIELGPDKGDVLIVGWGSTYGVIKAATIDLLSEGKSVAFTHLRYLLPLPKNLAELLNNYKYIVVPELNRGQLVKLLREKYLIDAKSLSKIQGQPLTKNEIETYIEQLLIGEAVFSGKGKQ